MSAEAFETLLRDLRSLNPLRMRTFNRCYLHPLNMRCCSKCFTIFNGIEENFHLKKYYSSGAKGFNIWCKKCKNEYSANLTLIARKSPKDFIRTRFAGYRARAKEQGLDFNITPEYLYLMWEIQNGLCHYTNVPMSFEYTKVKLNAPHLLTPSLDKLFPKKGYIIGNVVWCSYQINRMKNEFDFDMFIDTCRIISEFRK